MINFIRFDEETGKIYSSGCMKEEYVNNFINEGQSVLKTSSLMEPKDYPNFKVDLETLQIVPASLNDYADEHMMFLKGKIINILVATDYTQAVDAVEHIPQDQIDAWRTYRSNLRAALKAETFPDMVDLLPLSNPKGIDIFSNYRN